MSTFPTLGPGANVAPRLATGWDRCSIGGRQLPGHSQVTKAGVRWKIDKKAAAGVDGANPVIHGREAQEIEIRTVVWTDKDLFELYLVVAYLLGASVKKGETVTKTIKPSIRNTNGTGVGASVGAGAGRNSNLITFDQQEQQTQKLTTTTPDTARTLLIDHPQLRAIGIYSAILVGMSAISPSHELGRGARSMTFHLHHHITPKKNATRRVGGAPPVRSNVNYRAQDAAKRNPKPSEQAATVAPPVG